MEEQLNFNFLLSLQEIAIRKLVVHLWTAPDILYSIENFFTVYGESYGHNSENWHEIVESKVKDKVSKLELPLPKSLAKRVLVYVTPIGLEIKQWRAFHRSYLSIRNSKNDLISRVEFDAAILAKLCWTPAGTVDYRKTAEEFLCFKLIDIVSQYRLACLYCLEDYIPALWKKLPKNMKSEFYKKNDISENKRQRLEYSWPYILNGELSNLNPIVITRYSVHNSFNSMICRKLIQGFNKAALEYFFQKITPDKKESYLLELANHAISYRIQKGSYFGFGELDFLDMMNPLEKISEVLCYLLSLMNYEQQVKLLKDRPAPVLRCFLDWPWQDHFLKLWEIIWPSISPDNYRKLLRLWYIHFKETKYYIPDLFREFFLQSPENLRRQFVARECNLGEFFYIFFHCQDSETVKVIFSKISEGDRVQLVSCEKMFELFYSCIWSDKWDMVKVCLQEAALSKEECESLKRAFLSFLKKTDRGPIKFRRQNWKLFIQLLEEVSPSVQRKRSSQRQALNEAKKLCSGE